jgi:hypothetical protein
LQNAIKPHAAAAKTAAPKPDFGAKAKETDAEALFKRHFKRKIISAKVEKTAAESPSQP